MGTVHERTTDAAPPVDRPSEQPLIRPLWVHTGVWQLADPDRASGAILAGGRSSRFGRPKALATLGGTTIIERVIAVHSRVFRDAVIVGDGSGVFSGLGLPLLQDTWRASGPLGGVHAALVRARERGLEGVCITPCDAPFIEAALLRALLAVAGSADAVLPRAGLRGVEPLFAWYSCRAIPSIEAALAERDLSMRSLVARLGGVRLLSPADMKLRNPPEIVFFNVNTPADYRTALAHLSGIGDDEG